MEPVYTKFNRLREPKYQIQTSILNDGGSKSVIKKGLTRESQSHISEIYEGYHIIKDMIVDDLIKLPAILEKKDNYISFEYIDGTIYDKLVAEAYNNRDKDAVNRLVAEHYYLLKNSFKTDTATAAGHDNNLLNILLNNNGYKNSTNFNKDLFYEFGPIDFIFENIIIKDGLYYFIDLEWVFNNPVPVSFVMFRAVNHHYNKHWRSERNNFIPFNELLNSYGINTNDIELFQTAERSFQKMVFGKNFELMNKYSKSSIMLPDLLKSKDSYQDIQENKQLTEQKEILLKENEVLIRQLNDELGTINNLLSLQKETIESQRYLIDTEKNASKTKDSIVRYKEELLEQYTEKINQLSIFIESKDSEIVELQNQINTQQEKNVEIRVEIDELIKQVEEYKEALSISLYNNDLLSNDSEKIKTDLEVKLALLETYISQENELKGTIEDKERLINKKDEELKSLKVDLAQIRLKLSEKEDIVNEKLIIEEQLRSYLNEKEQLVIQKTQELNNIGERLSSVYEELSNKDNIINAQFLNENELKEQLYEKEQLVIHKAQELNNISERLSSVYEELSNKDNIINAQFLNENELKEQLYEKEQLILRKTQEYSEIHRQLNNANEQLEEKDVIINEKEKISAELEQLIEDKEQINAKLQNELYSKLEQLIVTEQKIELQDRKVLEIDKELEIEKELKKLYIRVIAQKNDTIIELIDYYNKDKELFDLYRKVIQKKDSTISELSEITKALENKLDSQSQYIIRQRNNIEKLQNLGMYYKNRSEKTAKDNKELGFEIAAHKIKYKSLKEELIDSNLQKYYYLTENKEKETRLIALEKRLDKLIHINKQNSKLVEEQETIIKHFCINLEDKSSAIKQLEQKQIYLINFNTGLKFALEDYKTKLQQYDNDFTVSKLENEKIKELNEEFNERNEHDSELLLAKESIIADLEEVIRRQNIAITDNEKKLSELVELLSEKTNQIEKSSRILLENEQEIADLYKINSENEVKREEQDKAISKLSDVQKVQESKINRLSSEIEERNNLLAAKEEVIIELKNILEEKFQLLREKEEEKELIINYFKNSNSWSITKPLRFIRELLSKDKSPDWA